MLRVRTTDRQRRYRGQFTLEKIFDAEHGLGAVYCIYTFAVLGQMQAVLSSPLLWSRAEHGLHSIVYHQTSFWNFKKAWKYRIYSYHGKCKPHSALFWSRAEHSLHSIVYHQTSFWNFKKPGSTGFIGITADI